MIGAPDEVKEFSQDVTDLWNYGKYQPQIVTAQPGWNGRRGEFVWFMSGTTGILYVCTSNNTNQWSDVVTFVIP